ncbi:tyrosyl-DNA phosphodiesterase 1 [Mortierella alpina]|uniref:Tyrosyl-DNA phosphodiesterase 1 n=1 Tax=Mortierella alpina TaxID=64518 RepID=A0A9P6M736_MORAP|nr:tyrosyl-DNA phosphodiesterase 1 [Mortierella alpina]
MASSIHIESSDDDGSSPTTLPATPALPDIAKPQASAPSVNKRSRDDDGSAIKLGSKKSRPAASIRYLDPSIRLMTVQRAPASHNVNCPDLELMVQINYMIEVDFVMNRVHESLRDGLKTIVYHGLRYTQDQLRSQSSGLATCAFERDLLEYLRRYPQHEEITSRISQHDFTSVKGVLIGSVPGKFTGSERNRWGHLKLRAVLRQQVEIPKEYVHGSRVICQDQADSGENFHVCMMNSTMVDPYPEPQIARSENDAGNKNPDELPDGDDLGGYSDAIGVVPIRLPYDLPLTKYNFEMGDQVWLSDKFFPGQDDYGETLER